MEVCSQGEVAEREYASLSVKELKQTIEAAGLSHNGVLERRELEYLASMAIKLSKEAKNSLAKEQNTVVTINKRRSSMLKAKKKLASTVGDSKVGRATLMKFIGDQGVDILNSLKEAVTLYESRSKAKELKKDSVKWIMKICVLVNHKILNSTNTSDIKIKAQAIAEKLVSECVSKQQGHRIVSNLSSSISCLRFHSRELLTPFAQPKNLEKLDEIFNYYGNHNFLHWLLNSSEGHSPCTTIVEQTNHILSFLPSVFDDFQKLTDKLKQFNSFLAIDAEKCLSWTVPEVTELFINYLKTDGTEKAKSKGITMSSFKFLREADEYAKINSRALREPRAKVLFKKYVKNDADEQLLFLKEEDISVIVKGIGEAKPTLFKPLASRVKTLLKAIFEDSFVKESQAYLDIRKNVQTEHSNWMLKRVRSSQNAQALRSIREVSEENLLVPADVYKLGNIMKGFALLFGSFA